MADGRFNEIFKDFAKDSGKETNGVWMTYNKHEYLIARSHRNNVKFAKLMEELMRPYQWALRRDDWDAIKEVANDLMQVVYAKTILLAIRRLGSTEQLDYTPEDGVALFKALPDFWDLVYKFSNRDSVYSPDAVKDDSKNS